MAKQKKGPPPSPSEPKNSPFASLGVAPSSPTPPTVTSQPHAAADEPEFGPKVVVRREKKGRKGKTVTRITGIMPAHLSALQAKMKKAMGCGATIEDEDLVLLGSLVDRAADYLEARGARRVVRSN